MDIPTSIVKKAQHELQHKIYACKLDMGVVLIRDWLYDARDRLNAQWPSLRGDDLSIAQGRAAQLADLIKLIDKPPALPLNKE